MCSAEPVALLLPVCLVLWSRGSFVACACTCADKLGSAAASFLRLSLSLPKNWSGSSTTHGQTDRQTEKPGPACTSRWGFLWNLLLRSSGRRARPGLRSARVVSALALSVSVGRRCVRRVAGGA